MSEQTAQTGSWIGPFEDIFLGLDGEGRIQTVAGKSQALLGIDPAALQGTSWDDVVTAHAPEASRAGLRHLWQAVAGPCVAAPYWPPVVPFAPQVMARLRPAAPGTGPAFVAHLLPSQLPTLEVLVGEHTLDVVARLARLARHVFGGTDGPLTDLQVRHVGDIVSHAESALGLLENVRAAHLLPAVAAPARHSLDELFTFEARAFTSRRIETHCLTVATDLPAAPVYAYALLRDMVYRVLVTLIGGATAESTIRLTTTAPPTSQTVRVEIRYHTCDSELAVETPLTPAALLQQKDQAPLRAILRLITTLHACVQPLAGDVWAEPMAQNTHARIVLVLPVWTDQAANGPASDH
jgi:hypothetical protein